MRRLGDGRMKKLGGAAEMGQGGNQGVWGRYNFCCIKCR